MALESRGIQTGRYPWKIMKSALSRKAEQFELFLALFAAHRYGNAFLGFSGSAIPISQPPLGTETVQFECKPLRQPALIFSLKALFEARGGSVVLNNREPPASDFGPSTRCVGREFLSR